MSTKSTAAGRALRPAQNKNKWHFVTAKDQKRIFCSVCESAGLPRPAEVCEHAEWNTGNTTGVSFWYYCLPHGIERGFHTEEAA